MQVISNSISISIIVGLQNIAKSHLKLEIKKCIMMSFLNYATHAFSILIQLAKVSNRLSLIIMLHTVGLCIFTVSNYLKFTIQVIQFNPDQMVYITCKIQIKYKCVSRKQQFAQTEQFVQTGQCLPCQFRGVLFRWFAIYPNCKKPEKNIT